MQDCVDFSDAIIAIFPNPMESKLWGAYSSERTEPDDWKDYGEGLVCISFVNAGGQRYPGEGIIFENNVLYRLVVYETPEYAAQAAATVFKREKTMVRGNKLFAYAVDQGNKKNVSPMILKAAEDFLNRED